MNTALPKSRARRQFVIAALLSAGAAQAQVPAGAERQGQVIERQQQERLREAQERALQQPQPREGADLQDIRPKPAVPDIGPGCHDIREIRIENAPALRPAARTAATRDFAGKCLGANELEALLAMLTKDYIDRGFVTARIYLTPQDLRTGVLRLTVVEGTIERYQLEHSGLRSSASLRGAFPARPGEPLNLRDLEQGLEQLNALQSNGATMDLQPGAGAGQSVVVVRNRTGVPVHFYLSYDNLGSPATGRDNVAATLSFDSLLGFNELIAFTRSQTVPQGSDHKADATALRVAVPFGYNSFTFDASRSNYTNGIPLPSGLTLAATGRTTSFGFGASRVVLRNQDSKASVSARLAVSDSQNFIDGQLLAVSSRKLTTLELAAAGFTPLAGGMANGRAAYVRGLHALGAMKDLPGTPDDFPRAQFGKLTLDAGYQRRFQVAAQPVQWTSQFSLQHSQHALFGSQQFLVGSPGTVRGSRLNSLSGDHGELLRNDVAWPWRIALGDQAVGGTVYAGYDVGRTRNRAGGNQQGSMSGVTLGATAQWRRSNLEVFASRAAHLPDFMSREGTLYGVRLSYSL
jgi:hemolysin activation/secretion protein